MVHLVSIVCCTIRKNFINNILQNYKQQNWREKELIIIINKDNINIEEWKLKAQSYQEVSIFQLSEKKTLGECLNFGAKKAKYELIAKFDDDDYYAANYITDSMKLFNTMDVDIIGKKTIYMYFEGREILAIHKSGKENRYVANGLKGATLIFKKEIIKKVTFPELNLGEDTIFIRECIKKGFKLYSTNKKNYVCLRMEKSTHHTWNINNEILLKKSSFVCRTSDYKPFILN